MVTTGLSTSRCSWPDWRSRRKLVLIVDEADKLPEASREALNYLLRQAPQNLHTVIAARPDWRTDLDDLVTYGQCVVVDQRLLRFDIDETLQLVQARAGARIDRGIGARLHVLTEGWPLGLQLALSIVLRGGDASAGVSGMAVLGGELQGQLVTLLLANLADDDRNCLVRTAILDHLHPICAAWSRPTPDASDRLARLSLDTPVFVSAEGGAWRRMHAVVRDALRERFATLPEDQRRDAHARAASWLADEGLRCSARSWPRP